MDDYPLGTSGEWYTKPDSQIAANIDEEDKLLKAVPLIEEVVLHLKERVAFRGDIDSIPADLAVDPLLHQKLVEVNRQVRDDLQQEISYITNILSSYLKK